MTSCGGCSIFLRFLLKFFNFLLALVGAATIIYALWILYEGPSYSPPALAPSPADDTNVLMTSGSSMGFPQIQTQPENNYGIQQLEGHLNSKVDFNLGEWKLPAQWFTYCLLGIGVAVCLITCSGHIAAETTNGCCLSCYTLFVGLLILLQAAFVADIFLNKHWEEDIPFDPTGVFDEIKHFVEENLYVCKLIGLVVVIIEALSILLAMCLRALVPNPRNISYDSDDEYVLPRSSIRQPLVNRQGPDATVSNVGAAEGWPAGSEAWSTRMREKYGLETKDFQHDPNQETGTTPEENKSRCAIM